MQLKLYIPLCSGSLIEDDGEVIVRTEQDIRTAGFAVARGVREWLRRMPFVPSTSDLHYGVSAEVLPEESKRAAVAGPPDLASEKRKRKAKK